MGYVLLIDDEVSYDNVMAIELKSIIESKGYEFIIKNRKVEIDEFVVNPPSDCELVLLDLDLSKIRTNSKDVLKKLKDNKIKVIILSGLPKTSDKRKDEGLENYQVVLPDWNKLKKDGAAAYIYKSEVYNKEKREFVGNIIAQTIKDAVTYDYTLTVNCDLYVIEINELNVRKSFSQNNINANWQTATMPKSSDELILRLFYEMAKAKVTEIKISNYHTESLKLKESSIVDIIKTLRELSRQLPEDDKYKITRKLLTEILNKAGDAELRKHISKKEIEKLNDELRNRFVNRVANNPHINEIIDAFIDSKETLDYTFKYPDNFQKNLLNFNNDIKAKSRGVINGRLLQATGGHGNRSGIYKANISRVVLHGAPIGDEALEVPPSIESRLLQIEGDIIKIKEHLGLT